MKTLKTNKRIRKHYIIIPLGAVTLLWLVTLTYFMFEIWRAMSLQSKNDSESIYKLLIDNSRQQKEIDELKSQLKTP